MFATTRRIVVVTVTILALAALAPAPHAAAGIYTWDNTTDVWGNNAPWGGAGPLGADPTDVLNFGYAGADYTATVADGDNNLPNPFVLNRLVLGGTPSGADGTAIIDNDVEGIGLSFQGTDPAVENTTAASGGFNVNYTVAVPITINGELRLEGTGDGTVTFTGAWDDGGAAATIRTPDGATYVIDGPLTIADDLTLRGGGGGATINGDISDGGAGATLTKLGTSTFTLNGANTYLDTVIERGTVLAGSPAALGSGDVILTANNNSSLHVEGDDTTPPTYTNTLRTTGSNGDRVLRLRTGDGTWSGAISLEGNDLFVRTSGQTLTFTGALSGSDRLVKHHTNGGGTLVFNPSDTSGFTGRLQVNDGTLELASSPAAAAVDVWISRGSNRTPTLNLLDTQTLTNPLTAAGHASNGTNVLTVVSNGTATYAGPITLDRNLQVRTHGGTIEIAGDIADGINGPMDLVKHHTNGNGTLVLNPSDVSGFTGIARINKGVIEIGPNAAASDVDIVLSKSGTDRNPALRIQDGQTVTNALTAAGDSGAGDNRLSLVSGATAGAYEGHLVLDRGLHVRPSGGVLTLGGTIADGSAVRNITRDADSSDGVLVINPTDASGFSGEVLNEDGILEVGTNPGAAAVPIVLDRASGRTPKLRLLDGQNVANTVTSGGGGSGTNVLNIVDGGTAATLSGDLILDRDLQVRTKGAAITLTGAISGDSNLIKHHTSGAGTLHLNPSDTSAWVGDTQINQDTLTAANSDAFGPAATNTVLFGRTGNNSTNAIVELEDGVTIANNMTVRANNGDKTLRMVDGATAATPFVAEWSGDITLDNTLTIQPRGNTTLTLSGVISGANDLESTTGNHNGTVVLRGDNTYTGSTYIRTGVWRVEHPDAFGDATDVIRLGRTGSSGTDRTVQLELADGITLDRDVLVRCIGSGGNNENRLITLGDAAELSGNVNLANQVGFRVGVGGTARFSGDLNLVDNNLGINTSGDHYAIRVNQDVLPDGSAAGGTLIMSGDSSTLLTIGSDTHQGRTRVHAGTLQLDGSLHTYRLIVEPGATLTGNGTLTTVDSSNFDTNIQGTLAPGDGIGTFTNIGDLRFTSGGAFQVEVAPDGSSDLLDIRGEVRIQDNVMLEVLLGDTLTEALEYIIVNNDEFDAINGEFLGWPDGSGQFITPTSGGAPVHFWIDYQGGDGNDIAIHSLPEPATLALLGLGALALARRRRRRQR